MYLPIYSHRDVFNDGESKLHPGLRIGSVLLVLTNTRPKQTPFVMVPADSVQSQHFKAKSNFVYLTAAYNQEASRFNDVNGGFLHITEDMWEEVTFKFNLPDNSTEYFIKQPTT